MVTTTTCAPGAPFGVGVAATDAAASPAQPDASTRPSADAPARPDTPPSRTATRGIGFAGFEKVLVTSLDVSDDDSDSDRSGDGDSSHAALDSGDETARVAASVAEEHKHLGNTAVTRCVRLP